MAKKKNARASAAKKHSRAALGVGVSIAAIAATLAVGGYLLYGKNGAKNRKKVKGWMLKARGEVLEQVENLRDMNISEEEYRNIVDKVAKRYKKLKSVSAKEVEALAKELKGHWKEMCGHGPLMKARMSLAKKAKAKKTKVVKGKKVRRPAKKKSPRGRK
ncbi:MAG: hypothetical protein BMS9Abin13_210 [Patescibacteria group bacterium]|nr:MAG: hypothetical protein BMS9Abin13_210 [Patescibacteria group bacterium]